MNKLAVAVIGSGGSASAIHLPGYAANPAVDIVGITSLDPVACARLAERFAIHQVFDSVDELVADATVEAVSICTPPSTHEPLAAQAAAVGRHVLIEKPVSTSLEALDRVRALALASPTVVELVHNERFMDFNIKAKAIIQQGELGDIQAIHQFISTTGPEAWTTNSAWFRDPSRSGGGVLMDLAVHKIDLAGWLLDRRLLPGASAQFEGEVEDLASIHMVAEGHVLLTVTASWRGPADEATLLVMGTRGTLQGSWTTGRLNIQLPHRSETVETEIPWTEGDNSAIRMIAAFVDACVSKRRPIDTDALWDTGTRQALEAYASKRTVSARF